MTPGSTPRKIEPKSLTKIWGSTDTEPWFKPDGNDCIGDSPVGEVWYPAHDLLIKFLFTSQKLSVQVHPDDDYASRHANSRGKTEMWHILRADKGAQVALGFKRQISQKELMSSAESGEIMQLLNWMDVQKGDTYFVPAGTVHAIGGGLALCEIQQNSDVVYRLFDYGRDRELHLEPAREASHLGTHPGKHCPRDLGKGVQLLVECPWFRTYRAVVGQPRSFGPPSEPQLDTRFLVVLDGTGQVGGLPASPGAVFESAGSRSWWIEPNSGSLEILLIS